MRLRGLLRPQRDEGRLTRWHESQWVPTWLIIGLYNKVVQQEGHDQRDKAEAGLAQRAIRSSRYFVTTSR